MEQIIIPENYQPDLNLHDTQVAIKTVKDFFQNLLSLSLNLSRVSAPLFVTPESGLNDNLNGVERPVSFDIREQEGQYAEVVHSLAKWKRFALHKYGFAPGEGLYTDMNAIRRDEDTDNIHSVFVDQWDWEKIITKEERSLDYLKNTVKTVYRVLRKTEKYMAVQYDYIHEILPHDICFITTQELEDRYPDCTPKEREYDRRRYRTIPHLYVLSAQSPYRGSTVLHLEAGYHSRLRQPRYSIIINHSMIYYNHIL